MELHQIRYLLSLSKTLNFTRAAEECNVSQPALSRAVAQLEAELGGELFRRERNLTHMTEFGSTVLPELRRCYEASVNAKAIAREFQKEGHAPLNLTMSRTIEMELLSPFLAELYEAFPKIEIKVSRGPSEEIAEKLKSGEAEVGLSGPLANSWDRFEARKLYEQQFGILLCRDHKLSQKNHIELSDLAEERFLSRPKCAISEMLEARLRELGAHQLAKHEVPQLDDMPGLVQAHFGVGLWPTTKRHADNFRVSEVEGVDMKRWIHVHTVFGRRLTAGAAALVALLRAQDWASRQEQYQTCVETVH
jgi:DNA-binding transcriptional LysR family regulator